MSVTIVRKNISLNVGQPNNFELICAMQDDNKAFEINATIYNGNELYDISGTIRLKGENPVGDSIYKEVDSFTSHTVTFTLTEDMLRYEGLLKLVLVMTGNGTQITTFPFVIKVVNSPGLDNLDSIRAISEYIEEAKKWANLSKSYAIGTDNEVRDGDSIDNSKYYYEQTKKLIKNSGFGNGNILYYETYDDFLIDYNEGNIESETLIVIKESVLISNTSKHIFQAGDLINIKLSENVETNSDTLYYSENSTILNSINHTNNLFYRYDAYNGNPIYVGKYDDLFYTQIKHDLYKTSDFKNFEIIDVSQINDDNKIEGFQITNNKLFAWGVNGLFYLNDNAWTRTNFEYEYSREDTDDKRNYLVYRANNGSKTSIWKNFISNIFYYNNKYVLSTICGLIYYSIDGISWTKNNTLEEFDHMSFLKLNSNGFILLKMPFIKNDEYPTDNIIIIYQSIDGINWNLIISDNETISQPISYYKNYICMSYFFIENYHYVFISNGSDKYMIKYGNNTKKILYKHDGEYDINNTNLSEYFNIFAANAFSYKNKILVPIYKNGLYDFYKTNDGEHWELFTTNSNSKTFYEITDQNNQEVARIE